MMNKIKIHFFLTAAVAAVLVVFFVWPVLRVVREGFYDRNGFTLWWLGHFFEVGTLRSSLLNSVVLAMCGTAAAMAIGVPLAILTDRVNFRGSRWAAALIMVPMILPPFVGAMAYQKIFASGWGMVNLLLDKFGFEKINFLGGQHVFWMIVLLEALHLYPIAYLNAAASLANIDPSLSQAARGLGAKRWRVFSTITAPLARGGLFAGATIIFIWCFCEFGTPLMFNYNSLLAVKIYDGLTDLSTPTQTYAMVFLMMSSAVGMYIVGRVLFGSRSGAAETRSTVAEVVPSAGIVKTILCWCAFGAVTLAAAAPHIVVSLQAVSLRWEDTFLPSVYTFDHLLSVFRDARTWGSIVNSLRYAAVSTLCCAVLGVAIAHLVVRVKIRGAVILDSLSMAPLAVPGLVMAAGYVAITARGTILEWMGPAKDPTLIIVAAYSIKRIPYMVRSVSAGLEQTPQTLELASRNLGSGRFGTMVRITLPLIVANVLAGSLLTFAFNMLEVSDSLVLAQTQEFYPITKQLYTMANSSETSLAAALGVYGMILLGGTMLAANLLLGKRMGRLFRV